MNKKIDAANSIADLRCRIIMIIYFRRWMQKANVHIGYQQRVEPQAQIYEQLSQQVQETPQTISRKPIKTSFNLKFGDIIYFKTYLSDDQKGIIAGDGIASNKLECVQILQKGAQKDNLAEVNYFQYSEDKIYSFQIFQAYFLKMPVQDSELKQEMESKLDGNEQDIQSKLNYEELKKKSKDEINENESNLIRCLGQNVVYNEDIQLVHLYSQCNITLNKGILAKQHCCRELSLEEESSKLSNFRAQSLNSTKRPGEPIFYGDQIILINCEVPQWKLGVQSLKYGFIEDGLEVNASEIPAALKVCNYLDYQTQKDKLQQGINGKYLQSGDIIMINNRNLGGFLALRRKKMISQFLDRRDVKFVSSENLVTKLMKQDYFELNNLKSSESLLEMYEMIIDTESNKSQNINALWEIQVTNPKNYSLPNYEQTFLIKHVATSCYLMIEQQQRDSFQLTLTYNGMQPECQFVLKSKKNPEDLISYSESVKIQSLIFPSQVLMGLDSCNIKLTSKQQKSNASRTVFLFNLAPQVMSKTANRICSLSIYLFQFFVFLQDWGMDYSANELTRKNIVYDYNKSFNSQKNLMDEISQLFQSLENLKLYLNNDNLASSNEEIIYRQNAIRENGIINLLFCILFMIHFMIYGSITQAQQYQHYQIAGQGDRQEQNQILQIPDKSPQKLAKTKLDPPQKSFGQQDSVNKKQNNNCIEEIYSILQICIKGNLDSSNYLIQLNLNNNEKKGQIDLKVINFLITQLKYHRISVQNLLKESIRFTSNSDKSYMTMWTDLLKPISEDNVQDQTLFIEILSLIMIDPYENPILQSQDLCRDLLFTKNRIAKVVDQNLLVFQIQTIGNQQIPKVVFKGKDQTISLIESNEVFSNTYIKYFKKRMQDLMQDPVNTQEAGRLLKDLNIMRLNGIHMDFINTQVMKLSLSNEDLVKQLPILDQYECYVISVLNLYCSLCRGRNYKSIKTIKTECGIDQNFLLKSLDRFKNNYLRYEKCLINLYSCILLDMDPLVSITNFTNRCYLLEDIKTFDVNSESGVIFFDTSSSQQVKNTDQYQQFIQTNDKIGRQIVKVVQISPAQNAEQGMDKEDQEYKEYQNQKKFASYQIKKENLEYGVVQKYINFFCQNHYPEHLKAHHEISKSGKQVPINYPLYAQFVLEYILSILKLIRHSVDLGYNKLHCNIRILRILPNIFYALILKSENQSDKYGRINIFRNDLSFNENLHRLTKYIDSNDQYVAHNHAHFQRNWLLEFLVWSTSIVDDQLLVIKVYIEAISLLKTFSSLKMNMQILKYVGFYYDNKYCKSGLFPQLKQNSHDLLDLLENKKIEDGFMIQNLDELNDQDYKQFLDIFGEQRMINFKTLLFNDLCSQNGRNKLNEDLLNLLIHDFNYLTTLTTSMRQIEIIEDDFELDLLSIVNGNDKKFDMVKGPKELEQDIIKTIKYFTLRPHKDTQINIANLQAAYDRVQSYIIGVLELFSLKLKDKFEYFGTLQNILRNSGVHLQLIKLIFKQKNIAQRVENIGKFYKDLTIFFELFTRGNIQNQAEMLPQVDNLLDLALIPLNTVENQENPQMDYNYATVKISRLVICIIQNERTNSQNISDIIKLIIEKIINIGEQLKTVSQLYLLLDDDKDACSISQEDNIMINTPIILQSGKKSSEKEIILIQCLIQYIKILKSLTKTIDKPCTQIYSSKHIILTRILQIPILRFMIEPSNIFQELRQTNQLLKNNTSDGCYYFQVKLHAHAISLLTECCHNYRLGIQETQRALQYEEMKQILLRSSCFYIIKRVYLIFLFEVYINRVVEGQQANDVVDNNEVSDILSKIIIPDLDQQTIQKFLEGLVRPKSNNNDLRNQIQKKKVSYFDKKNRENTLAQNGITRSQILKDCSEYWKYIRDKGLIYFLICVFDEMKDRVDLEKSQESNLADEFSIIKDNISKIKDIFKILEQDFRMKQDELNLESYRELITNIEEIIPQRKITKFGKNFRIGFGPEAKLQFEKIETLHDDLGGEKKIQEQENVQVLKSNFKRNLKVYLMREQISIDDLLYYVETSLNSNGQPMTYIIQVVNEFKYYIDEEGINKVKSEEMVKIKQERQLKDQQQAQADSQLQQWDLFKQAMKLIFQSKKAMSDEKLVTKGAKEHIKNQKKQDEIFENFEIYVSRNTQMVKQEITKGLHSKQKFIIEQENEEQNIELDQQDSMNHRDTNLTDEQIRIIFRDSQIDDLIIHLQKERDILSDIELPKFLDRSIDIFLGNEIYMIKICRILLKNSMPNNDEMELIGQGNQSESQRILRKLNKFKSYQLKVANSDVHKTAIKIISDCTQSLEDRVEAIRFVIKLLEYGNSDVQQKLLKNFREEVEMTENFFSFLRNFLQTNMSQEISLIKQCYGNEKTFYNNHKEENRTFKHERTNFEQMALGVLKLLQVLCENVNVEFQMFLSKQNEDDSYTSNTNLVRDVSNFISQFLEDSVLKMKAKNEIIAQGIETLVEFTTGYQDNRNEICNNKRLFSLLNSNIINKFVKVSRKKNIEIIKRNFYQGKPEQLNKKWFRLRQQNYETLGSFVKLLLAMTQGNPDKNALLSIFEIVNKDALKKIMKDIYDQRISFKLQYVILDKICTEVDEHKNCDNGLCAIDDRFRSDEDNSLISTGFQIFIFFITLAEVFKDDKQADLALFDFQQDMDDEEYYKDLDRQEQKLKSIEKQTKFKSIKKMVLQEQQIQSADFMDIKPIKDKMNKIYVQQNVDRSEFYEQVKQDEVELTENEDKQERQELLSQLQNIEEVVYFFRRTQDFFQFYREFTGRIEIQKDDGQLQKVYFQKPFFCKFITQQVKHHLIFMSNRDSDQDRIQSVIENLDFYYIQMLHNQIMTRSKILNIGAKNWRFLKDISFLLVLFIVILLIVFYDIIVSEKQQYDAQSQAISGVNKLVTIVQLCLNGIICIFSAIERYPISITYKTQTSEKKIINLKTESGFHSNFFERQYQNIIFYLESQLDKDHVQVSYVRKLILIVMDLNNFYNIIYFIITIFAFNNPLLYALLLLDVIKRSEDLQNIIKSITVNLRNLAKFAFLGCIGMLLYAILAFQYFSKYYDPEHGVYAQNFFIAVTTTINRGLRSGGGFGDALQTPPDPLKEPNLYWGMYFYEFSFFILFNVLFIQIIFGIILDTFGQLRDEREVLLKEIQDKCFVCSLSRNEIDSKSTNGWYQHIYLEHNVYHMIFYLIYLKKKDPNDCDALEKYVKQCIEDKNADFFPQEKALQIPQ